MTSVLEAPGSILTICTGNICRSPYAEYSLRTRLDVGEAVGSAGTHGLTGWPADEGSEAVARTRGFSCAPHRARTVTAELVAGAQLVLAMAPDHREECTALVPEAAWRVFTLHELAEVIRADAVSGATLDEMLASAHAARADLPRRERMRRVADPFSQPRSAFERMAEDIEAQLDAVAPMLRGASAQA